jgi:hypothetical protein
MYLLVVSLQLEAGRTITPLVNPRAIAEVINAEMAEGNQGVSYEAVEEWLDKNRWDKKYFGDKQWTSPSGRTNYG